LESLKNPIEPLTELRSTTHRSILALLAVLTLGGPPPSLADSASDELVRQVTEVLRERDGRAPTDEELVGAMNVVTAALYGKGQYAEGEHVARVALERGEQGLGAEHPDTINVHWNLATTLVNQSKLSQAIRQFRALDGRLRGFVGLQLATTGSEQVRRDRVNKEARLQDMVYTLALAHPESEALPLAADLMLRWKRLAGEKRAARTLDWKKVRDALPRGSALLELRAFRPLDFKTGKRADPRWLALLIPADPGKGPALRVFDLGPTAASAPLLARLRDGEAAAEPLVYQALFGPLDGAIENYETLFLAPDGALDLVAFARLKLPNGRYWVQRQSLRELRTGRDLLAVPSERVGAGMLALGEIDYDHFPTAANAPAPAKAIEGPPTEDSPSTPAAPTAASPSGSQPRSDAGPALAANRRLRDAHGSFDPLADTGPRPARSPASIGTRTTPKVWS